MDLTHTFIGFPKSDYIEFNLVNKPWCRKTIFVLLCDIFYLKYFKWTL